MFIIQTVSGNMSPSGNSHQLVNSARALTSLKGIKNSTIFFPVNVCSGLVVVPSSFNLGTGTSYLVDIALPFRSVVPYVLEYIHAQVLNYLASTPTIHGWYFPCSKPSCEARENSLLRKLHRNSFPEPTLE